MRYDRKEMSVRLHGHLIQRFIVNINSARRRRKQADNQIHNRTLSRPRRADDCNSFAFFDVQIKIGHHKFILVGIMIAYVVEIHFAFHVIDGNFSLVVFNMLGKHDFRQRTHRFLSRHKIRIYVNKRKHRTANGRKQRLEQENFTRSQFPFDCQNYAEKQTDKRQRLIRRPRHRAEHSVRFIQTQPNLLCHINAFVYVVFFYL